MLSTSYVENKKMATSPPMSQNLKKVLYLLHLLNWVEYISKNIIIFDIISLKYAINITSNLLITCFDCIKRVFIRFKDWKEEKTDPLFLMSV